MIILDTNVISELARPECATDVRDWLIGQSQASLVTTTVVEAEILSGLAGMPDGMRRRNLVAAFEKIFVLFGGVLPFTSQAAQHYADISRARLRIGRPLSGFDGLIAATALANGASIATRNIADFEGCGVDLIDPWMA